MSRNAPSVVSFKALKQEKTKCHLKIYETLNFFPSNRSQSIIIKAYQNNYWACKTASVEFQLRHEEEVGMCVRDVFSFSSITRFLKHVPYLLASCAHLTFNNFAYFPSWQHCKHILLLFVHFSTFPFWFRIFLDRADWKQQKSFTTFYIKLSFLLLNLTVHFVVSAQSSVFGVMFYVTQTEAAAC